MSDSKEFSWAWVTASQALSHVPCELVSVVLVATGATTDSTVYNGTTAEGAVVFKLVANAAITRPVRFPVPIYCPNGLYVEVGSNVAGILVQWRASSYD